MNSVALLDQAIEELTKLRVELSGEHLGYFEEEASKIDMLLCKLHDELVAAKNDRGVIIVGAPSMGKEVALLARALGEKGVDSQIVTITELSKGEELMFGDILEHGREIYKKKFIEGPRIEKILPRVVEAYLPDDDSDFIPERHSSPKPSARSEKRKK